MALYQKSITSVPLIGALLYMGMFPLSLFVLRRILTESPVVSFLARLKFLWPSYKPNLRPSLSLCKSLDACFGQRIDFLDQGSCFKAPSFAPETDGVSKTSFKRAWDLTGVALAYVLDDLAFDDINLTSRSSRRPYLPVYIWLIC
jgi:hypothetical protein